MDTASETDEVQFYEKGHRTDVIWSRWNISFSHFLLWIAKWREKRTSFNEFYFVHVMFKLTELMRQLSSSKHNKREDFLTLLD